MSTESTNMDKFLLRRVSEGDEIAFRELFDHYKGRFYAVVLKMTRSDDVAQEIVQETFIKIWSSRTLLNRVDNPDSYFFTAVYHNVFNYYKKMAKERNFLNFIGESESAGTNMTDEAIMAKESALLIDEAVARLPPQQQLVFKLSKQEGMSREQVAEKLHISPNTVRNHMAEAIKFIRGYLGKAELMYVFIQWLFKH